MKDFPFPEDFDNETPFSPTSPPWFIIENQNLFPGDFKEIVRKAFHLLEKNFRNYKMRQGQLSMALDIMEKIFEEKNLVLEAGTGIGKTFAYLIPVLAWSYLTGQRALIITETKSLQVQIIEKDLPILCNILKIPEGIYSLALGSNNYLCHIRYDQFLERQNPYDLLDKESFEKFQEWAMKVFESNNLFGHLYEKETYWPKSIIADTCRDSDGCPATKCIFFSNCNYYRARKKWEESRIIVANTHLYLTHLLNEKKILPEAHLVVIDEAHGFTETAYTILTQSYPKSYLLDLEKQANRFGNNLKILPEEKSSEIEEIWKYTNKLWIKLYENIEIETGLTFEENKSKTITQLEYQSNELTKNLNKLSEFYEELQEETEESRDLNSIRSIAKRLKNICQFAQRFSNFDAEKFVYWAEKKERELRLSYCPIEISGELQDKMEEILIMTSATIGHWTKKKRPESNLELTNNGYFANFSKQIFGQRYPQKVFFRKYPSPFAYHKQCVLYIPKDREPPEYKNGTEQMKLYEKRLFLDLLELSQLSKGGCLILFTSHYLLQQGTKFLRENSPYPVYSQSELGAHEALNRFLVEKNALLLGVNSFWQGIDIPGSQLRLLIITKLLFQPPEDPLFKARSEYLEKKGGNPFQELSLPWASIMLRQGFGRLIRSEKDRGVVAILDSRMLTRHYGQVLLANLPQTTVVHTLSQLEKKIAELKLFAED